MCRKLTDERSKRPKIVESMSAQLHMYFLGNDFFLTDILYLLCGALSNGVLGNFCSKLRSVKILVCLKMDGKDPKRPKLFTTMCENCFSQYRFVCCLFKRRGLFRKILIFQKQSEVFLCLHVDNFCFLGFFFKSFVQS